MCGKRNPPLTHNCRRWEKTLGALFSELCYRLSANTNSERIDFLAIHIVPLTSAQVKQSKDRQTYIHTYVHTYYIIHSFGFVFLEMQIDCITYIVLASTRFVPTRWERLGASKPENGRREGIHFMMRRGRVVLGKLLTKECRADLLSPPMSQS